MAGMTVADRIGHGFLNHAKDGILHHDIQINLIPHTVAHTTLQRLRPGDRVNLEIDTVARYLARMRDVEAQRGIKPEAGLTAD